MFSIAEAPSTTEKIIASSFTLALKLKFPLVQLTKETHLLCSHVQYLFLLNPSMDALCE